MSWLRAVFVHRCPRCLRGALFAGLVRMHRTCPVCALQFEREPGYFLGAMYFSYALAVACAVPVMLLGLALGWPLPAIGWTCAAWLFLLSPWLMRASRSLWLRFDQRFDAR